MYVFVLFFSSVEKIETNKLVHLEQPFYLLTKTWTHGGSEFADIKHTTTILPSQCILVSAFSSNKNIMFITDAKLVLSSIFYSFSSL